MRPLRLLSRVTKHEGSLLIGTLASVLPVCDVDLNMQGFTR
jgi:hypothetical protein